MRVGILTGGGDCAALNAAIHGVAASLMQSRDNVIFGIEDGIIGLIEKRIRPLLPADLDGLMGEGGTFLGTCNSVSPFNYRGKDASPLIASYYQELGLDCVVAMGGDGTMSMCHQLSPLGLNFVGVPKTIDNDIMHNDRSFGFDTAVSIVAESIERIQTTGRSHHRVMIVETMGRYAGWIALYGGVAGDANIILIPEHSYQLAEVVRIVKEREKKEKHTLIVVAEGVKAEGGALQVSHRVEGSPDPVRLGGIGKYLEQELAKHVESEIRTTVLGHVQRGGPPTAFDRLYASNLGAYAARLVSAQDYGHMVCVQQGIMRKVPLADVANQLRLVPDQDMTLYTALASGISLGSPNLLAQLDERRVLALQMH